MVDDFLIQKIIVKAKFKNKPTVSAKTDIVQEIQRDMIRLMDGIGKRTKPIGAELGRLATYQQHYGLLQERAIFTHALYDSIRSKQVGYGANSSQFNVGTSINDKYPLILARGRKKRSVAKHTRALPIRLTPNSVIFRKSAKPSKPRDYMKIADRNFTTSVPTIVEAYLNETFN